MARIRHYHVLLGDPGCMPDTNEVFSSRREAERYAAELAREARDEALQDTEIPQADRQRVSGSARYGYSVTWGSWGSGYSITVDQCDDRTCQNGD